MMNAIRALIVALCFAVPAVAHAQLGEQAPPPAAPVPSIVSQLQGLLGRHLAVGALASYDWTAGDWERPYAVGPAASWTINKSVILTGSAKRILNSTTNGRWRSEVQVLIPFYGSPRTP